MGTKFPAFIATGTALTVLAAGPIVGGGLGLFGFGAAGVTAGSLAASIQAGIGNVAAGSLFAFLQSAGAGGVALPVLTGVVKAVLATALSAVGAKSVLKLTRRHVVAAVRVARVALLREHLIRRRGVFIGGSGH
ncbi:hypothetical protein L198_06106 [Cryptococcus wingfieldii CBS 7118]|uniref:Uncharacterized protein n=1 Tax=Cryptococcus wingfieldii CBS 7118 TaxID=1295528 RepID=A0A1E3IQB8_9TREE|nr:hypothetical protein L198_06106 [Cryptococcus wingfieldii CBS 7118]ODN90789.1 hypothetical protein L198_06106 [Cryptococcus wingfieldii CBS 7118]